MHERPVNEWRERLAVLLDLSTDLQRVVGESVPMRVELDVDRGSRSAHLLRRHEVQESVVQQWRKIDAELRRRRLEERGPPPLVEMQFAVIDQLPRDLEFPRVRVQRDRAFPGAQLGDVEQSRAGLPKSNTALPAETPARRAARSRSSRRSWPASPPHAAMSMRAPR